MPPGTKVMYLGAASGTTVSHVSDIVGPVSLSIILFIYIEIEFFLLRLVLFMQLNSHIDLVVIY
jgi:hypothetical protein